MWLVASLSAESVNRTFATTRNSPAILEANRFKDEKSFATFEQVQMQGIKVGPNSIEIARMIHPDRAFALSNLHST
jgi:hypothetical protein